MTDHVPQTGADALVSAFFRRGVSVCFANPGTTELHLVAALGRRPEITTHLCLFEGVATGAADGYARMSGTPALVLLHLGPGLANGMANLHNAKKAASPVITLVGEHATYHLEKDAPLTADIAGMARPVSDLVVTMATADRAGPVAAEVMAGIADGSSPVATVIVANDAAWSAAPATEAEQAPLQPAAAGWTSPDAAAATLRRGERSLLLIGARHVTARMAALAAAIEAGAGCMVRTESSIARMERGKGRHPLKRLPFHVDDATRAVEHVDHVVLAGAKRPVAFFAYPGRPSEFLPETCLDTRLCPSGGDVEGALEALAAALGVATVDAADAQPSRQPLPAGRLDAEGLAVAIAATLPDQAVIIDEAITNGGPMYDRCATASRHDWINNRGGSIGHSLPAALGAAIACPERRVVCVTGDGSAAYAPQALWSMARAHANVTVVILANRAYRILSNEMSKIGAGALGPETAPMLEIGDPAIDWTGLARSFGVASETIATADELAAALARSYATPGPSLITAEMSA